MGLAQLEILGECSALWGERERVVGDSYMLSGYCDQMSVTIKAAKLCYVGQSLLNIITGCSVAKSYSMRRSAARRALSRSLLRHSLSSLFRTLVVDSITILHTNCLYIFAVNVRCKINM